MSVKTNEENKSTLESRSVSYSGNLQKQPERSKECEQLERIYKYIINSRICQSLGGKTQVLNQGVKENTTQKVIDAREQGIELIEGLTTRLMHDQNVAANSERIAIALNCKPEDIIAARIARNIT